MHKANGLNVGEKTIISYEMGKASWIRLGMSLSCVEFISMTKVMQIHSIFI